MTRAALSRFAGRSAVYAAGAVFAKGGKFLLIPFYVRILTQAEVGILVFVEAVALACSRTFSFGLAQAVKRFYVDYADEADADAFAAALFWVGAGLALLGLAALAGAVALFGDALTGQVAPYYLMLALVIGALQSTFNVPLQRLIVRGQAFMHSLLHVLRFLTMAGLVIYLVVVRGLGIDGVLWGQIGALAAWNVVLGISMVTPVRPVFRLAGIRDALAYSAPLLPHALFAWGITFSDRLILERFVPLGQVGVYGMGYQLASIVPIVSLALVNAWLPGFFRTGGSVAARDEFARMATYVFTCLAALAVGLFAFAPELVRLVLATGYEPAAGVFRIVLAGLVLHGMYQALLLPIFFSKRTGWVSATTGTAFAVNVGLNLALVPRYGIMAAAWATVAAYAVTTLVAYHGARRAYGIQLEAGRLARVAGWTLAVAAAAWAWPVVGGWPAVASKLVLAAVYVAGIGWLPGILSRGERAALLRALRAAVGPSPAGVP